MKQYSSLQPGTRVLMANFPADGHFNPLTGIAQFLKEKGCDVRWYTSSKYQEKINKLDIKFYPLKKALDFGSDPDIDKVFEERKNHKSQIAKLKFDIIHAFVLRGPEYYEDIQEIYHDFAFDIMIADIAFTGIAFVKDLMKIPVIGVSVFPLSETSKDLPPTGLAMTPSYNILGRIKQSVLRTISDKVLFAEPNKVMKRVFKEHGIECEKMNLFDANIQKSSVVLQSGTPGFEYKRSDMSKHIHFAGPLLPRLKKNEGEKWYHPKLAVYSKVVLITQGTVERDINKLMVPTLDAFKGSDTLVIATTGGSGTENLRQQFPQPNFIIEDFIPFDEVMPYAHVYISNGGYGGVLLSIMNELPMVVAGVHEGKNEINARIGYFNLGINLKTEKPKPESIKLAVDKVLRDKSFRENVIKLSREFSTYNPDQVTYNHVADLLKPRLRVLAQRAAEESIY